jgi:hypothetical protein
MDKAICEDEWMLVWVCALCMLDVKDRHSDSKFKFGAPNSFELHIMYLNSWMEDIVSII